jgi:hypothetical protein
VVVSQPLTSLYKPSGDLASVNSAPSTSHNQSPPSPSVSKSSAERGTFPGCTLRHVDADTIPQMNTGKHHRPQQSTSSNSSSSNASIHSTVSITAPAVPKGFKAPQECLELAPLAQEGVASFEHAESVRFTAMCHLVQALNNLGTATQRSLDLAPLAQMAGRSQDVMLLERQAKELSTQFTSLSASGAYSWISISYHDADVSRRCPPVARTHRMAHTGMIYELYSNGFVLREWWLFRFASPAAPSPGPYTLYYHLSCTSLRYCVYA